MINNDYNNDNNDDGDNDDISGGRKVRPKQ